MPSLVEANTSGDTTQVGVCDPNGRVDQGGHQLNVRETNNNEPTTPRSIVGSIVNFDPQSMPTEDEFTFEAHASINEYLEKHMRCTLNKENRTLMHKEHPVPKTPAMRPPQVDKFIKDHLGARFPAREYGEFAKVQSALLKTCGPIACLWSELIENGLLEDPDASINVLDVMDIMQRTLVLLGNANELLSQARRTNLLQIANSSLAKYGQEPQPQAGEFLFGPGFTTKLKSQVETDTALSKIISLLPSQRFHPYTHKPRFSSTIGRTKQQFFRESPAGNRGARRGGAHPSQYRNQPSQYRSQLRGRGTSQPRHQYQSPAPQSRRN